MSEKHVLVLTKPSINVTPLIDVLLVMLIIFMVAAPLRPHRFSAKVPSPPDDRPLPPAPDALVVIVNPDRTLKLNGLDDMGTVDDMTKLTQRLSSLFDERLKNRAYRHDMATRTDVAEWDRVQKTVILKAPRSISYGEVARIIDGLKGSGADPIGLQLDGLN
jgi:biopolymer transport protein ExbD